MITPTVLRLTPGDLSQRHAFLVEQKNRLTLVRFDHGAASGFG
jgi:hypothetical protein